MTPTRTLQLHSIVHEDSTVTLALVEADLPETGPTTSWSEWKRHRSIRPIWASCSPVKI